MAWYRIAVTPDNSITTALEAIDQTIRSATSESELEELGTDYSFIDGYAPCEPDEVAGVASSEGVQFERWLEQTWQPEELPEGTEYYRVRA